MKKIHSNKIRNFLSSIFAGWNEIFFNFIFQIFLVPIFLYNWETKYYSLWIIFLTVKGLFALINTAQRDLIYQKILSIGKHNKKMIIDYTHSSFTVFIFNYIIIAFVIFIATQTNFICILLNIDLDLYKEFNQSLILLLVPGLFIFSELYIGIISVFGYYYKFAWLSLNRLIITNVGVVLAIILNANFLQTIITYILLETFCNLLIFFQFKKILKLKKIILFKLTFNYFLYQIKNSIVIFFNYIFVYFKTTGLRLIISSFYTPILMITFVLTRTTANILHQGIHACFRPMLPDVMNLFNKKNKYKLEKLTDYIGLFLCGIIAPSTIILCFFMPYFFDYWTNSEVEYNHILFSVLIQNIFLISIYLPYENILKGNNLNKQSIIISIISFLILFILIISTNKQENIVFVSYSLIISEIASFIMVIYFLNKLMEKKKFFWSIKPIYISFLSFSVSFLGCVYFASKENDVHILEILILLTIVLSILIFQYSMMKDKIKREFKSEISKIRLNFK